METIQYSGNLWNVQQQDEERPAYKYTRQAADKHHHGPVRTKRATKPKEERNTCSLFIQTDPLLWRHIKEQVIFLIQQLILILVFSLINIYRLVMIKQKLEKRYYH